MCHSKTLPIQILRIIVLNLLNPNELSLRVDDDIMTLTYKIFDIFD